MAGRHRECGGEARGGATLAALPAVQGRRRRRRRGQHCGGGAGTGLPGRRRLLSRLTRPALYGTPGPLAPPPTCTYTPGMVRTYVALGVVRTTWPTEQDRILRMFLAWWGGRPCAWCTGSGGPAGVQPGGCGRRGSGRGGGGGAGGGAAVQLPGGDAADGGGPHWRPPRCRRAR